MQHRFGNQRFGADSNSWFGSSIFSTLSKFSFRPAQFFWPFSSPIVIFQHLYLGLTPRLVTIGFSPIRYHHSRIPDSESKFFTLSQLSFRLTHFSRSYFLPILSGFDPFLEHHRPGSVPAWLQNRDFE